MGVGHPLGPYRRGLQRGPVPAHCVLPRLDEHALKAVGLKDAFRLWRRLYQRAKRRSIVFISHEMSCMPAAAPAGPPTRPPPPLAKTFSSSSAS